MEIVAEDFDRLLMIMAVLNQIKERHMERGLVFEPLRDIVDTLKLYSVDFSPSVYKQVGSFEMLISRKTHIILIYICMYVWR